MGGVVEDAYNLVQLNNVFNVDPWAMKSTVIVDVKSSRHYFQ